MYNKSTLTKNNKKKTRDVWTFFYLILRCV